LDRHDRWLCMMYPRLMLLRQFLRQDGAIFVSVDDNEVANLRLVMDEIFGPGNFVAGFAVQKRVSPDNDERLVTAVHDHLICYAKKKSVCVFNKLPRTAEADARYDNPDDDSRGSWTSSDLTRREYRPQDFYPITLPSGRAVKPASGRSWALPRDSFQRLLADNRIWFGRNGNAMPRLKRFLSEVSDGMVPTTWFSSDVAGDNQQAKRELRNILREHDDLFATPKPVALIQRILQIATDADSLVLDSFAGSGTTGQAVLKQNIDTPGSRRFILIEMDGDIAQHVTAERVRRVARGYSAVNGHLVEGLGAGYQYCRLSDEPLFLPDGHIRPDVTFEQLAEFVWFMETGTGRERSVIGNQDSPTPYLGQYQDRAIFLLYNGILQDKTDNGGNVLNRHTLGYLDAILPNFPGMRIVYGARCRFDKHKLERIGLTFHQLPYELAVKTWL